MAKADLLLAKHKEFEAAAARMKGARRTHRQEPPRGEAAPRGGADGHFEMARSLIYGSGPPKVRYESLSPVQDAESDRVVARLRDELGL